MSIAYDVIRFDITTQFDERTFWSYFTYYCIEEHGYFFNHTIFCVSLSKCSVLARQIYLSEGSKSGIRLRASSPHGIWVFIRPIWAEWAAVIAEAGECDTRQPRPGEASLLWCDGWAGTGRCCHRVTVSLIITLHQNNRAQADMSVMQDNVINGFSNMMSPPVNGKLVHKTARNENYTTMKITVSPRIIIFKYCFCQTSVTLLTCVSRGDLGCEEAMFVCRSHNICHSSWQRDKMVPGPSMPWVRRRLVRAPADCG